MLGEIHLNIALKLWSDFAFIFKDFFDLYERVTEREAKMGKVTSIHWFTQQMGQDEGRSQERLCGLLGGCRLDGRVPMLGRAPS